MSVTIQIKRGTEAQIQSADLAIGELAFATDTKSVITYDGVVKHLVGRALYDQLTNRPAYGVAGRLFMDSGTSILYLDTGSSWVQLPGNSTATKTANKIPIADGSGYLNSWIQTGTTSGTMCAGDDSRLNTLKSASFTQATSSPVTLLDPPNNAVVTKIVIVVDSAASAGSPTVSVGIAGDADRDMDETDSDLKTAATYIVEPYTACGTDGDNIILTITADSQTFSGRCYLHYAVPV